MSVDRVIDGINVPSFDKLEISTATVMVYSNIQINKNAIFCGVPIKDVYVPMAKKKKDIDKKNIKAEYGTIISVQLGLLFRGIRMSKKKKYWCPSCMLMREKNGSLEKVLTVVESEELCKKDEGYPLGTRRIIFVCGECKESFDIRMLRKIVTFLNQLTIVISIGDLLCNVMAFGDNFKIANNKTINGSMEVMMLLWEDYISTNKDWWSRRPKYSHETETRFFFEKVMENPIFGVGFPIDKCALNELFNGPSFKDTISLSHCETTSSTNVNIKFVSERPEGFMYKVLAYGKKGPYIILTGDRLYVKKDSKAGFTTLIVFSSSRVILTGMYRENLRAAYEYFIEETIRNRHLISEVINVPKVSIQEFMRSEGQALAM